MSATLPGRTYGLGLIKEPLRASLDLGDLRFNILNFWAIILGSLVTWPVDVWFNGSRTFKATIAGGRAIQLIALDPGGCFPDADPNDNVWPKK